MSPPCAAGLPGCQRAASPPGAAAAAAPASCFNASRVVARCRIAAAAVWPTPKTAAGWLWPATVPAGRCQVGTGRRLPDRCELSRGWLLHSGGERPRAGAIINNIESGQTISKRWHEQPTRVGSSHPVQHQHLRSATNSSARAPSLLHGSPPGRSTGSPLGVPLYAPRNVSKHN